jgi:hypothetical protein
MQVEAKGEIERRREWKEKVRRGKVASGFSGSRPEAKWLSEEGKFKETRAFLASSNCRARETSA